MAKPTLLLENAGKKVLSLVGLGAAVKYPMGIGTKSVGFDDDGAWLAAATHADGETFDASDGVFVPAGVDSTTVRKFIADSTGRQLVDAQRRHVTASVTPAISNGAIYAAKDAIGALMTFTAMARASINGGRLESVVLVDKGQQKLDLDLVLFSAALTAPTDNAIFDPTDAELATCVGVVKVVAADYFDFNDNSVAVIKPELSYILAGTSLFGVLVARSTPTYTSVGDLVVTLVARTD